MLSKEVCKRCVDKYARQNGSWLEWNGYDENVWNEKYRVFCPYHNWDAIKISSGVSKLAHCPYRLEIILRESRDAK
jgi:hypothetical protein